MHLLEHSDNLLTEDSDKWQKPCEKMINIVLI